MKKHINTLGLVLFIVAILFIGILAIRNKMVLNLTHKYTIGTVYHFEAEKGGFGVKFNYLVNTENFNASSTVSDKNENVIGKRFYVMYYPPNPKNSEILLDKPVSDNVKEAPSEGWDKLPE